MAKLEDIAVKAFKANPKEKHVYVTSDGNPFFNKNAAELHASTNPQGKKLTVKTFTNETKVKVDQPKQSTPKPSAEDRIANISKLETVAEVQEALKGENATTVKKAGNKRIKELEVKAKSGTNSPETRGGTIIDDTSKNKEDITQAQDYTQIAKYDELMQFVNDNQVELPNGKKTEDVRTAVIAYLENPNKVIVPFKAID